MEKLCEHFQLIELKSNMNFLDVKSRILFYVSACYMTNSKLVSFEQPDIAVLLYVSFLCSEGVVE